MKNSQNTFETRIGRFQDMIGILQTFDDYKPTNVLIGIDSLNMFLQEILNKNTDVITLDIALKSKRDVRKAIAFKNGLTNFTCIQACLDNITNYVAGEFGMSHPAYKQIYSIKKKINPTYVKKKEIVEGETPKTMRSNSEKSFTGLVGTAKQIIQIIVSLGTMYAPQNTDIQLANFTDKVNELDKLNQEIALALQKYSDAVRKRKDSYDGTAGLKERVSMIRSYMASFVGGKHNPQYEQVLKSLKGS